MKEINFKNVINENGVVTAEMVVTNDSKAEMIAELLNLETEQVEISGDRAIINFNGAVLTVFPENYGRSVSVDIDLRDCKSILTADESYIIRDIYLNESEIAEILD